MHSHIAWNTRSSGYSTKPLKMTRNLAALPSSAFSLLLFWAASLFDQLSAFLSNHWLRALFEKLASLSLLNPRYSPEALSILVSLLHEQNAEGRNHCGGVKQRLAASRMNRAKSTKPFRSVADIKNDGKDEEITDTHQISIYLRIR